jgi:hypothetical protein
MDEEEKDAEDRSNQSSHEEGNFELSATEIIQGAFLESFVKIFFAYRDFLVLSETRAIGNGELAAVVSDHDKFIATNENQLFTGGDRQFQIGQYLRCLERQGVFGNDSLTFIRTFTSSTQSWDIFIRTAALNPIARLFDTACEYYCIMNKLEYTKFFKQMRNILIVLKPGERFVTSAPDEVIAACDSMGPCPVNVKPRDHFFSHGKKSA